MKKIIIFVLLFPISVFGFDFDGWQSGMSIEQVKKIARQKQLPIAPGTSLFLSKYNEKAINKQPKQRAYAYRTQMLGLTTSVVMYFTNSSQSLYRVKASISPQMHTPEGGKRRVSTVDEKKFFYESLYSTLASKYGKAKKVNRPEFDKDLITAHFANIMVGRLLQWKPNDNDLIHLNFKDKYQNLMQYKLIYTDQELVRFDKAERENVFKNTVKKNLTQDEARF